MQADPSEYRQLDLRAHTLLSGVEVHDVWVAELEGGGKGRTIQDARRCFNAQTATTANAAVRTLFAIRRLLGGIFAWDKEEDRWADESYVHKLTEADLEATLETPGIEDGPFKLVYVFENEALSEVRNATVHAFSCLALREVSTGYRLYWAIYVKPIGALTARYMRLIDPFRRAVVYPSVIRRVQMDWSVKFGDG